MRRTNLLPPEERPPDRRHYTPTTRTGIIGLLLILGALLVILMICLYLFYFIRLSNEEDRIAQVDQNISRQQARLGEFASFRDLQARLNAKKRITDGIFRTRFTWDEFLRGLAFVIPDSTALDNFTGQATLINVRAPAAGGSEAQNLEPPGIITFSGVALPEYQNISDFIIKMNNLRFLANARLNNAELGRKIFSRDAITCEVAAQRVTKVGENGDEVLIDSEDDGGGGDGESAVQGGQPNRTKVGR